MTHSAAAASGPYDTGLLLANRPVQIRRDHALALQRAAAATLAAPQRTHLLVAVHDERQRAVHHQRMFLALAANQRDADADGVARIGEQVRGNPDERLVVA